MSDSTGKDHWAQLAESLGVIGDADVANTQEPAGGTAEGTKRRRRRRSRKKPTEADAPAVDSGDDSAEEVATEAPAPELPAPDPKAEAADGEPAKRRRRRSRKKKPAEGEAPAEEGVAAVLDDEAPGEGPSEPVSVAHLPTWQEIIDGLYRP